MPNSFLSWLFYGRGDVGNRPVEPDEPRQVPAPPAPPAPPPPEQKAEPAPPAGLTTKQKVGGAAATAAAVGLILSAVYANEGGYVNDPADPGGATRYGVTEKVARANGYRGDMRNFPMHCTSAASVCADALYAHDYIEKPGYMPLLPIEPAVVSELVDTTVNMGSPRPSRWFQQSLGELGVPVKVDGRFGAQSVAGYRTLQATDGKVPACVQMLDKLDAKQLGEYKRLVERNPKLRKFYKGWVNHRIGNVDRRTCGRGWE